MQTGTVVRWLHDFGFITPSNGGRDVFVFFEGIVGEGYRKLEVGQRVQFDTEIGPKGKPQACNLSVIDPTEVNGNVA